MKIKISLIAITLFLGIFGVAESSLAATYYVSETGCSDSYAGTLAQPWCTIQKASSTASAGDTVYVRAGTYAENINISKSGTSSAPIIFMAYPSEKPLVKGSFSLNSKNYIHIKDFEIMGGGISLGSSSYNVISDNMIHDTPSTVGIHLQRGCSYNVISNNDISYGSLGIRAWKDCTYNRFESNHIYMHDDARGNSDCMVVFGPGTRYNLIKKNILHDCSDDGFDTWNGNYQLVVQNISYHNGYLNDGSRGDDGNGFKGGGADQDASGGGHLFINNIAYDNPMMGLTNNGGPDQDYFYHNVSHNNGHSGFEGYYGEYENTKTFAGIFRNNVAYQNGSAAFSLFATAISSNNISQNPLFMDATNHNYRLNSNSPARDAGRVLTTAADIPSHFLSGHPQWFIDEIAYQLSHDFDDKLRPQGSAPDIGAYEYASGSSDTTPPSAPKGLKVQ